MESFEIVDGCVKIDTFHHISKTRVNLFQDKTHRGCFNLQDFFDNSDCFPYLAWKYVPVAVRDGTIGITYTYNRKRIKYVNLRALRQ